MTMLQSAGVLGCSEAKVSRMENGIVSTRVGELLLLLDTYSVNDAEQRKYLEYLARSSNKQGWWESYGDAIPPHYAEFIGLETDASYIRTWQSCGVPGLLQTPDYTRALMRANAAVVAPAKIDAMIGVRQERQRQLFEAQSTRLHAIVWEPALTGRAGGSKVWRTQVEALLSAVETSGVQLQVLPLSPSEYACLSTPFVLFSFGNEASGSTVFLENATSSHYLESDEAVSGYTLIFDTLRTAALSTTQTVRFLRKLLVEADDEG